MSWLFPDERQFYEHLTSIAKALTTIATLLEQGLENPALLRESMIEIDRVQHETDASARDLDLNIEKLFIPPMDREDIHLLSTVLARVADLMGGTARRAVSLRVTSRREHAVALAKLVVRAVNEIEAAVSRIKEGDEVLAHCRTIKRIEEEGDATWEEALDELFAGAPDPVDVIRCKAVYDQLEDTLDACEDVANELETLTVKH